MDREAQYLLHLLKAFVRREAPADLTDVDWEKLMGLAHIHNISGILGYMAMSWPVCPDPRRKAAARSLCLNTIGACTNRAALAERFSLELARAGIDHILMKGFVLRDFFPVPELRTFGDIDIVIHSEDRGRCHAFMEQQGFRVRTDWEPVYSYIRGSEFYEIHSQIMEVDVSDKADYRGYFQNPWEHVVPMGDHRWQFKPEYHFLYMLTHIAKHVTGSGAGIRMYLDVAVFLQHYGDSLDWEYVRRELDTLALGDFSNTVLTLTRDCFGTVSPVPLRPVARETMEDFLELTMNGGVFGRNAQDSGTNSLKQDCRDGGKVSRAGTLAKRLLPPAQSIQSRYTYLRERPWLLPVAWVHRLVKTRESWQTHTLEARNILSADKEAVRKLNRLYRNIGL